MNFKVLLSTCVALSILIGCNTPKGLERRSDRLKRAYNKKGVFIPKDTVRETDTLTTVETINDTVYITKQITTTLKPEVIYETKWQTRYKTKYKYKTVKVENKAMIDSLRQVVKIERSKQRHETKRQRKSKWWLWFLIGLTIGIFHKHIIRLTKWILKSKLGI